MTPKPTSAVERASLRVVIVTLDNHLASSVDRARRSLQGDLPGLDLAFHAAADWNDPAALRRLPRIHRQGRHHCRHDAVHGGARPGGPPRYSGAPRSLRRDCRMHVGARDREADARRPVQHGRREARRVRFPEEIARRQEAVGDRRRAPAGDAAPHSAHPAVHPRLRRRTCAPISSRCNIGLPGPKRTSPTWSAFSSIATRTARTPSFAGGCKAAPPVEYPEVGLYHPRLTGRFGRLRRQAAASGRRIARDGRPSVDALVHSRRQHGALRRASSRLWKHAACGSFRPSPAASTPARRSKPSSRKTAPRRSTRWCRSPVFRLSAAQPTTTPPSAAEMLRALDVPYIAAHALEFQTIEQWEASDRGLMPVEATMMVAIPELDGAMAPIGFRRPLEPRPQWSVARHPAPSRAGRTARGPGRAPRPPCEGPSGPKRKVAIVLFDFPPNGGAAGTAAFLGVYASLHRTLIAMRARGLHGRGSRDRR